jgi:hypothetical protein
MLPSDRRILAVAAALVGLLDALAIERKGHAGDELVPLASCGVERRALRRLAREGRLEVVRIGRRQYTTRRALAGLVTLGPVGAEAGEQATDPAAAARKAYAAPLRLARGGGR